MREALFSILGSRKALPGARVLDLYAGTGALGLEALSRGAASVTFVESAPPALLALRQNVAALGVAPTVDIFAGTAERFAHRPSRSFDVVFADPPYALVEGGAAPQTLGELITRGALSPDGVLVLEHGKTAASPSLAGLVLEESRRYGDSVLAFYAAERAP